MSLIGNAIDPQAAKAPVIVPTGRPETSVRQVRDSRFLAVHLTPYLWAYLDMDEAVALRAQLDSQIARLSERFL